jgi:hypothetical protein
MGLRVLWAGAAAVLTAVAASSADAPSSPIGSANGLHPAAVAGSARLYAIGTRSAQQRNSAAAGPLDSVLADLSRHAGLVRAGRELADLHSLSPAAKFSQSSSTATPLVLIDATTRGDPLQLKAALVALGLERAAVYSNDVGGWLPVTQIAAAAADVVTIRAAMPHIIGATEGDFAERSDLVSEAEFADGIAALAQSGAQVIADDVGYFDEPYYQKGLVAQAVDAAEAAGVASFSVAENGSAVAENSSVASYENAAPRFATVSNSGSTAGERLLNFDTTGATDATALPVSIPAMAPGRFVAVVVQWDQPYVTGASGSPGASSRIDLCVSGGSDTLTDLDGNTLSCTGPNALGVDPYQIMIIANPADASGDSAPQTVNIAIGLAGSGDGSSASPGRVRVSVEDDGLGSRIESFATAAAAPPTPTLTLGATKIQAETTTTITWSSAGATACIAGGNENAVYSGWTGTLGASGTNTIDPVTPGTYIYSISCSNSAGTSPTATVTLTVTASVNIGSAGGGALDAPTLFVLAGLLGWGGARRRFGGGRST